MGAAKGLKSAGVPHHTGSSNPTYMRMTKAAVAGVGQAGTSFLAACADTARSAPPSNARVMQPLSQLRAVQLRAQVRGGEGGAVARDPRGRRTCPEDPALRLCVPDSSRDVTRRCGLCACAQGMT